MRVVYKFLPGRRMRSACTPLAAALLALGGCSSTSIPATDSAPAASVDATTQALRERVKTIVVIYAENRSFDNLYGLYPGAAGLNEVLNDDGTPRSSYVAQRDRADGRTLDVLPSVWGGLTLPGQFPVVSEADTRGVLENRPFQIDRRFPVDTAIITRDLWHRFFENQMQIDTAGRRDNGQFVAYADSGSLVMGYYDGSQMALWALARQYTLADHFFQGAFGGSFLNHQYLICACAPVYDHADASPARTSISSIERDDQGRPLPRLAMFPGGPASAMDGAPSFVDSNNLAPRDYFGDNQFHAINTMQPPYQPSANAPGSHDVRHLYADARNATTLPPQQQQTVGDELSRAGIDWAWYGGAWRSTAQWASSPTRSGSAPNPPYFQYHHQPFNYYANFDPALHAAQRQQHLKDYEDLVEEAAHGTLPPVVFYKPQGTLNEHSGYASVAAGDAHLAGVIRRLQASPQWPSMVIVLTYDEFGGYWDHVPPPKGDLLGPGTRIPALVISPLARRGYVDHTPYDTGSILRLIDRRFGLAPLAGTIARDSALEQNGSPAMGDLTGALDLGSAPPEPQRTGSAEPHS